MHYKWSKSWIVGGDFNIVRFKEEREETIIHKTEIFRRVLQDRELIDL